MAFSDDLSKFMGAIRQEESGGQYDIHPNRAGASGAYQFIDSTWDNYGGYAHAWQAPPDVQDEKARQLMTDYYNQFGSWDLVAAAWNGGPGTAQKAQRDPGYLSRIGDGNTTVANYVKTVMSIFGGASTSGAAVGAAVGATPAEQMPAHVQDQLKDPSTRERVLTGAVGLFSGKTPEQQYADLTSSSGDTLGTRLQSILGFLGHG